MAFKSKEDQARYHREIWYPANKERRKQLNAAWRKKVRDQFLEYKKTLSCIACGNAESVCLDFHHTNPDEKEMAVAAMFNNHSSFEKVMEEVSKCVVLCANCHRMHHAGILNLP
jgi:transcription elongation factor Elf1